MSKITYVAALAMIAYLNAIPAMAKDVQLEIKDYMFVPENVTVHVGDKITWINRDEVPHTVAEADKLFRSSALDTDDTYSYVFTKPGAYKYFCTMHSQMIATITVTP